MARIVVGVAVLFALYLVATSDRFWGRNNADTSLSATEMDGGGGSRKVESIFHGRRTSQWLQVIKTDDESLRRKATVALGHIGAETPAVEPALVDALQDGAASVRSAAAQALGKLDPLAESSVQQLVALLKDDEIDVRVAALKGIGLAGPKAESAVDALTQMFVSPERQVRVEAVLALGQIGSGAKPAVPLLIELIRDEDQQVVDAVLKSFASLGPNAEEAVAAIVQIVSTPTLASSSESSNPVVEALLQIGPAAVPGLVQALKDQQPAVRTNALKALGKIHSSTVLAENLKQMVLDQQIDSAIAEQQQRLAVQPIVEAISGRLLDDDPSVKDSAVEAVATIGAMADGAVTGLVRSMQGADLDYRRKVCQALGQIGPTVGPAVPYIMETLYDDMQRSSIYRTVLLKVGPAAIPQLQLAVQDRDSAVQSWALSTLDKILDDNPQLRRDLERQQAEEGEQQLGAEANAAPST